MALSDQENYDQPAKRRKKSNSTKPLALSQPLTMDTSLSSTPSSKRQSSVQVDAVAPKKARTQSQFVVHHDDEGPNQFVKSLAGVVQSVRLVNFMCHSHFEMKFNPRINFISGCNGSGKSAIQTAMVIGLGGTASKTNRSSKIDGLIKHGCQSASITIVLSNNGFNAYKPEEYGNTIRIVRNISRSNSNYKVYNQTGKLMASTKKEVENICSRFRIQPNNPVAILNQDMARNFLNTNKAEDKYALFRKAILLDEAETVLAQLLEMISDHENQLESKKRAIAQINVELDNMTKKMQLVEELRLSKAKRFELGNELPWTKVNQLQEEVDHLTSCHNDQIGVKDGFLKDLSELQIKEEELREKKKKIEEQIAGVQADLQTREEARQQLATDHLNMKKLYGEKCMECSILESNLKSRKQDYAILKRSLDDIQRMDQEQRQRKEEADQKISQLTKDLEVNESKEQVLRGEMSRLQKNTELKQDEKTMLSRTIDDLRNHIETCQRQIQSLGNNSDALSMYESWMSPLVRKIDEAVKNKRFSRPPIGPLGRYVKVKSENWMYAIESNLSAGFLSSFLVNDRKDRDVLLAIMGQVIRNGHKPTIHCSKFQDRKRDHDLPNLETSHGQYSNMLRALTVNNVVVTNFLMDYRNIHQILLVDSVEDCRLFIEKDHNIPRNCILILDLEANQYLKGYRTYANFDRNRRAKILQKSAANQLRSLQEEVSEKHELITQNNAKLELVQRECAQYRTDMQKINRELQTLKTMTIRAKTEKKEQQSIIEMEVPSLQMKLDEMKEIEIEMEQLEERRQVLIGERSEAQEGMMRSKQLMHTASQGDSFSQQTELNYNKDQIVRQLSALNLRISTTRKNLDEQEKKISNLNRRLKEDEEKLQNEIKRASDYTGGVVQTTRSTAEVEKQLKAIEKFIEEAKQKIGEESNEFQKSFYNQQDNLKKQIDYFTDLENMQKDSKRMFSDREIRINKLRDTNAIVIMTEFQNVLKSRNYRGCLKFDHATHKLDIMMAPIDGGNTLMSTSCLSGGEKSYSTVAFLLALWSNMNLPFYSMDEYDVFMDAINRKTITKLLMQFAKGKTNRQFIFLTPLDVSIIQISDYVQVHKVNKIQG